MLIIGDVLRISKTNAIGGMRKLTISFINNSNMQWTGAPWYQLGLVPSEITGEIREITLVNQKIRIFSISVLQELIFHWYRWLRLFLIKPKITKANKFFVFIFGQIHPNLLKISFWSDQFRPKVSTNSFCTMFSDK